MAEQMTNFGNVDLQEMVRRMTKYLIEGAPRTNKKSNIK